MPGTHWYSEPVTHRAPVNRMHQVARSTRRASIGACIVAVGLLVLSGVIVWAELRSPASWDPLGPYEVQAVLNVGNTVALGEVVVVDSVKCSDEPVDVRGTVSWQAIDPPGAVIETGTGSGFRAEGCTEQVFRNVVPPDVAEVIRDQHANGIDAPVWRITGTEVPVDGDREGVAQVWVTENFSVVP